MLFPLVALFPHHYHLGRRESHGRETGFGRLSVISVWEGKFKGGRVKEEKVIPVYTITILYTRNK